MKYEYKIRRNSSLLAERVQAGIQHCWSGRGLLLTREKSQQGKESAWWIHYRCTASGGEGQRCGDFLTRWYSFACRYGGGPASGLVWAGITETKTQSPIIRASCPGIKPTWVAEPDGIGADVPVKIRISARKPDRISRDEPPAAGHTSDCAIVGIPGRPGIRWARGPRTRGRSEGPLSAQRPSRGGEQSG